MKHENWKHWKESGAAFLQSNGMCEMWFDTDPAEASQGQESNKQFTEQCGGALSDMPQRRTHERRNLGSGEGGAIGLQGLRSGISTEEDTPLINMRGGLPINLGEGECKQEVARIPRVTSNVKDRVSRLKAIGNGQVPRVVAAAWEILK